MNRQVVLRCGKCKRKLDDVLDVRNVKPDVENRRESLRGQVGTSEIYGDRWSYTCRCGCVWPVTRRALVDAAYRAIDRGQNTVYAGMRDYGQPT